MIIVDNPADLTAHGVNAVILSQHLCMAFVMVERDAGGLGLFRPLYQDDSVVMDCTFLLNGGRALIIPIDSERRNGKRFIFGDTSRLSKIEVITDPVVLDARAHSINFIISEEGHCFVPIDGDGVSAKYVYAQDDGVLGGVSDPSQFGADRVVKYGRILAFTSDTRSEAPESAVRFDDIGAFPATGT